MKIKTKNEQTNQLNLTIQEKKKSQREQETTVSFMNKLNLQKLCCLDIIL